VPEAIRESKAKVVLVSNLVNKKTQTNNMTVSNYYDVLERYIGKHRINYVIYNNAKPPKGLFERYASSGELPVEADVEKLNSNYVKAIGAPLISDTPVERSEGDALMKAPRNYIRHDADKVSRLIMRIYFS
jgi:2-phospho-L-lactate transferase/gluconeogenesis factor (CofD/UPF0052 family)